MILPARAVLVVENHASTLAVLQALARGLGGEAGVRAVEGGGGVAVPSDGAGGAETVAAGGDQLVHAGLVQGEVPDPLAHGPQVAGPVGEHGRGVRAGGQRQADVPDALPTVTSLPKASLTTTR